MSFKTFTLQKVREQLGLDIREADLFSGIEPMAVSPEFLETVRDGCSLVMLAANEKARSEFLVAPLLMALRRLMGRSFGLFSGTELNVDESRDLNGFCDFVLARDARQLFLNAPIVTIVETKDEVLSTGFGQCIAEMLAAQIFNEQHKNPLPSVYGVVTSGNLWKFLRLTGTVVTVDEREHHIENPGRIMGILRHIILAG